MRITTPSNVLKTEQNYSVSSLTEQYLHVMSVPDFVSQKEEVVVKEEAQIVRKLDRKDKKTTGAKTKETLLERGECKVIKKEDCDGNGGVGATKIVA